MKAKIDSILRPILFFSWSVILVVLSVLPSTGQGKGKVSSFRWDYLEHFGVFVVFSLLYGFWRWRKGVVRVKNEMWWFLAIGAVFATTTELLQFFVEGRTVNPMDVAFNLGGVFVGITIVRILNNAGAFPMNRH